MQENSQGVIIIGTFFAQNVVFMSKKKMNKLPTLGGGGVGGIANSGNA